MIKVCHSFLSKNEVIENGNSNMARTYCNYCYCLYRLETHKIHSVDPTDYHRYCSYSNWIGLSHRIVPTDSLDPIIAIRNNYIQGFFLQIFPIAL